MAASILLGSCGIAHWIGQFSAPPSPAEAAIYTQMRDVRQVAMGREFSLYDVMQVWGVYFGLCVLMLGIQSLLTLPLLADHSLRRLAWWGVVVAGVMSGLALWMNFVPPALLFLLPALGFLIAALRLPAPHRGPA
jgi:hypothetical protein